MENLFSTRDTYSANFGTELAKSDGGSTPDFKVFVEPKSFSIDSLVDWNLGTFNNVVAGTNGTFGTNGNVQLRNKYAISLSGTQQHCVLGTTLFSGVPQIGAVEMLIYPRNITSFGADMYQKSTLIGKGNTYRSIVLEPSGSKVRIYQYDNPSGAQQGADSNGTISLNNWYHIIYNWNGTSSSLYINGTLDKDFGTFTWAKANPAPDTDGANITALGEIVASNGTVFPFDGKIDDFRLYGTELTSTQISNRYLYDTFIPCLNKFDLEEGSGTITQDLIGTITGTLVGATWEKRYGTYTSKIYDSGFHSNFKQLNMTELLNGGTTQYQFRTGTDVSSCDVATWKAVVSGTRPAIEDGEFYQFRIALTGDGTTSPVVDKVQGTTQYSLGERLISAPEVSRSLERLFQETQISSIGINLDNTDDFFNPLGTGLYAVSSVYNKTIEIWKGFKYAWNGSTWGTAEYVPAFTGYVDNIQIDGNGRAVLNTRDKGKLFYNNTSEDCTQTGTAGGAYWTGLRIDEDTEKLLQQTVNYGIRDIDYVIDKTVVVDSLGIYHFVEQEFRQVGSTQYGFDITFLKGTYFFFDYASVYSYIPQGTAKYEFGLTTEGRHILNDGTRVYAVDGNSVFKWDNGTIGQLYATDFRQNAVYYNGYIYTGTGEVGAGTVLLHKYNVLTGSYGTCNNDLILNVSNFALDSVNGKLFIARDMKTGTVDFFLYNLDSETGTTASRLTAGYAINSDENYILNNRIKYNATDNTFYFDVFTTASGTIVNNSIRRYVASPNNGDTQGITLASGNGRFFSAIETDGTKTFITSSAWGTFDNPSQLYIQNNGTLGTIGTIDPKMYLAYGLHFSERYTSEKGTVQPRLMIRGFNGTANPFWNGTSLLAQYSPEYNLTIGTFDVGAGDKVADVLQTLAEASNYVQYIDEGGVYYFKRRDSGTTIDYTFGTNDIVSLNVMEGEGISQSPIFNKGVWGTNTGTVSYEDLPSQGTYGLQAYTLSNKWITSPAIANDVLYGIVNDNKQPKAVISAKLRYYPVCKLFDVVGLDYGRLNLSGTKPWQIVGLSEGNTNTTLTLKEI